MSFENRFSKTISLGDDNATDLSIRPILTLDIDSYSTTGYVPEKGKVKELKGIGEVRFFGSRSHEDDQTESLLDAG